MGESSSYVVLNAIMAIFVCMTSILFICRHDKTPVKQRGHAVLIGCMASIGVCIAEMMTDIIDTYTCGAQIIHLTIGINILGMIWLWRCFNLVFAFAMTRHHYADHVQQTRHHRVIVHPDREDLSSRGDTLISFPSTIDTSNDDECLVRHRSWRASSRLALLLCTIGGAWITLIIVLVTRNDQLGVNTRPLCDEARPLLLLIWGNGVFFMAILLLSSWQLRGHDSDRFEIKRELKGTAIIACVISLPLTISGFAIPLSYQRETFHVTPLLGTLLITCCNCYATGWPVMRTYHHEHNHNHHHHTHGGHTRHHGSGGTGTNNGSDGGRSPNYGQSPISAVHGSYGHGRSTTSTTATVTPAVSRFGNNTTPHHTPPGPGHSQRTRQIYRDTSARDLHAVTTLTELLATDEGTNSFRRYLAKEFNIENLSFVTAVQVFTALASSPSRSQEEVVASALSLYRKYIVAGAPFQVNLSGAVTRRIRDDLKPFMPTKANRSTMAAPLALVFGANSRASGGKHALVSPVNGIQSTTVVSKPASTPKGGNTAAAGFVSPARPPTSGNGDGHGNTTGRPPTSGGSIRPSGITVTSSSSSSTTGTTTIVTVITTPVAASVPPGLNRVVSIPTLVINIPTNDGVTTTTVSSSSSSSAIPASPKAMTTIPSPKASASGDRSSGRRDIGAIALRRGGGGNGNGTSNNNGTSVAPIVVSTAWQPSDYKAPVNTNLTLPVTAGVTVGNDNGVKKLPLLKPSIFFEAQQMIMGVLSSDVFPRYLKSSQYRDYCRTINNQ